jgi:ketosteroid isomerase-like protein
MSQENVQRILELAARVAEGDVDRILELYDKDVEYDDQRSAGTGVFTGIDAGRSHWEALLGLFADLRLEPTILADPGDQVAVAILLRGHDTFSGGYAEIPMAILYTFREGLIRRLEVFNTEKEALEAVGLRE